MSQHWDPFQQNKPCFYILLLAQFIANSTLPLFLFPLPSFHPSLAFPLAVLCCLCGKNRAPALAKSDINSFLSSDVQQNLPLINICSVSEPQGYWLHFVFIVACFLTLCCSLYIEIPPPHLRPGARVRQWTGHSSSLTRVFPPPPSLWNKSLFVSLWTIKSRYCGEAKKIGTKRVQKAIQECRPMDFWPLFSLFCTDFLISFPSML